MVTPGTPIAIWRVIRTFLSRGYVVPSGSAIGDRVHPARTVAASRKIADRIEILASADRIAQPREGFVAIISARLRDGTNWNRTV
jgi:hypothetical protein